MTKDIKYLVIPDVHGRTFWIDPVNAVLADTDAKIIFLGDYLDPYPYEFEDGIDFRVDAITRFEEIIELKKTYPDRITLLLGNHDCGYAIDSYLCSSRMDRLHKQRISRLFKENRELFQMADTADIASKHFVFSHAGILKGWAEAVWEEKLIDVDIINELNHFWWENKDDRNILSGLGMCDYYRGWGGYTFGSPIWSDIRSWTKVTPEDTYGFNIVGHTQCKSEPIVLETIANLDCRQVFYIDGNGDIRYYNTGEIVKPSKSEI